MSDHISVSDDAPEAEPRHEQLPAESTTAETFTTAEQSAVEANSAIVEKRSDPDDRIYLPSPTFPIWQSAQRLYRRAARKLKMFAHAGATVEVVFMGRDRAELRVVTPSRARSLFEEVGELWRDGKDNHGRRISRPSRCSKDQAEALLDTREALDLLPPLSTVVAAPVLTVDTSGRPRILKLGYHRDFEGIFVSSKKIVEDIPPKDAAVPLLNLIRDFKFQTPDDKARAIAAILTPALVNGRLLGDGHIPLFMVEANKSQAGKGLLHEITAAIYRERPVIVVGRDGGVGGRDEDLNAMLLRGCPFVLLDNLRGKLDSPHLEAFLTAGGPFSVRGFRRAQTFVDPRRYIVLATSNGFKITPDLENRFLRIRIYKRSPKHKFALYNEELLHWISANQPYLLGCVFSIVSEWIRQGRPGTGEERHSFRQWAQAIDWILVHLFKLKGRVMDYGLKVPGAAGGRAAALGWEDDKPATPKGA